MSEESQPDIRSLVSYLNNHLGPKLMGVMCGCMGPAPVEAWMAKPPNVEIEAKLRVGFRVAKGITDREGVHVARAWLMGMNPQLRDENPLIEIDRGNGRDVLIAARVYLQDPSFI